MATKSMVDYAPAEISAVEQYEVKKNLYNFYDKNAVKKLQIEKQILFIMCIFRMPTGGFFTLEDL